MKASTNLYITGIIGGIAIGYILSIPFPTDPSLSPQPTPQIVATSTEQSQYLFVPSSSTAPIAQRTKDEEDIAALQSYLPILKALKSGQVYISANNVIVPTNGSSTDLMAVLQFLQNEINAPK